MEPLQQKAYDYLKEQVLKEHFTAGAIYSLAKTAEIIGMSRTPVRDALQRLSQENMIDIIPSKGFRVHEITQQDIVESFQFRTAVEGYCALYLARHCHTSQAEETLLKLRFNLEKQKNILFSSENIDCFIDVDIEFHTLIVEFVRNRIFTSTFQTSVNLIRRLARISLSQTGRMRETYQEHRDIYDALFHGNTSQIYDITFQHMVHPQHINLNSLNLQT